MSVYDWFMEIIRTIRVKKQISQRQLALISNLSFRTIQLLEKNQHDSKFSSLNKIAMSFGHSKEDLADAIKEFFNKTQDSVLDISKKIKKDGIDSWKIHLFNFVDQFRKNPECKLIDLSPISDLDERILCLITSTVEALCYENDMKKPFWTVGVEILNAPWFPSGIENLKTMALVESPVFFRKRNIFVLNNFLDRI